MSFVKKFKILYTVEFVCFSFHVCWHLMLASLKLHTKNNTCMPMFILLTA